MARRKKVRRRRTRKRRTRRIGKGHMKWGDVRSHRRRVAKPPRKRRRRARRIGAVPGGVLATMSRIKRPF